MNVNFPKMLNLKYLYACKTLILKKNFRKLKLTLIKSNLFSYSHVEHLKICGFHFKFEFLSKVVYLLNVIKHIEIQ